MATIIMQIARDAKRMKDNHQGKKLQLTMVTDHGNRKSVDHFVKQICWSSYEDGKHILRHFNLDIDKGGHTTVDAANAIHKSLKALHLDDIDVEFSFICGDSGGGAKVQDLHPRLVAIEAMSEFSDYVNCILHAFNLSYEHACKDIFGDQGVHRNTVFQMVYLAVLMMKTLKKNTDLNTLKSIYANAMTKALTDQKYKDAAGKNFMQAFDELMDEMDLQEDENAGFTEELERDLQIDELLGSEAVEQEIQQPNYLNLFSSRDDATAEETTAETTTTKSTTTSTNKHTPVEKAAAKLPTNMPVANFCRWGTISKCSRVVLEHWLPIANIAQTVQTIEKRAQLPTHHLL
jgi:hypothetical protein